MSLNTHPHYPDLESAVQGTEAPQEIISQLELVPVDFVNFDFEHEVGQLVIATDLAGDIQEIFGKIRNEESPIFSIIPIAWFDHNDHLSIAANNTSAFNYRQVINTTRLSRHSFGRAVDLNPEPNPYLRADGSPMPGSFPYKGYDPSVPGTIVQGGVVVRAFEDCGWEWGGNWEDSLDYQHFNKD